MISSHAQLRQTQQRRLPEHRDLDGELRVDIVAAAAVVGETAALVEELGDLVEHLEDGLAPDLGRMGRDDRAHLESADHLGEEGLVDAVLAEPLDRGGKTARSSGVAHRPMVPSPTLDVDVLRGVGEQRQPVERAQDGQLLVDGPLAEGLAEVGHGAGRRAPPLDGDPSDAFDQLQRVVTIGGADGIAEQPPEEADVVAQLLARILRSSGQIRHPPSQQR